MPKLGMQPIRRRQLIDATIASIRENGFAETTVSQISRRAGVSTGIVHHYFENKEDLLEATLRALAAELWRGIVQRLAAARTPKERAIAVIDGNFAAPVLTEDSVAAWLSFWAAVPTRPRFARIQRIIDRRMRSNLRHSLKQLMDPERAADATEGLCAIIDGLWLHAALSGGRIDAERRRRIAIDYLEAQLREVRHAQSA
jgi:transcriptional repressor BetI